ncbi:MAG: rRNA maturation RNase YbeY [Balneolales bacterium]
MEKHPLFTDLEILNETDLPIPLSSNLATEIVKAISAGEAKAFSFIEVVFVDEAQITKINKKYLDHHYITDIITFGYNESDQNEPIEATLFCCAPRIVEQATDLGIATDIEFSRVFIHGLLHLTGYRDHSKEEKAIMRDKENLYLNYIARTYAK